MAKKPLFPFGYTKPVIAVVHYKDGKWQIPQLLGRKQMKSTLPCHTAHYGEGGFEGGKCFRNKQGRVLFFRPEENYSRLIGGMTHQGYPPIPEELYYKLVEMVSRKYARDILKSAGDAMYIRPLFYNPNDESYGVLGNDDFVFTVGVCSLAVHNDYKIRIIVEENDRRASKGGTGKFKLGCNYAAARGALKRAVKKGFNDVLFTSRKGKVEELSSKNFWWQLADGTFCTPKLKSGTILPGIIRKSLIELMILSGLQVREANITVEELCQKIKSGEIRRMFSTGTAITIAEITSITFDGKEYTPEEPITSGGLTLLSTLRGLLNECYFGQRQKEWTKELFKIKWTK